jgi:hypothetical protein
LNKIHHWWILFLVVIFWSELVGIALRVTKETNMIAAIATDDEQVRVPFRTRVGGSSLGAIYYPTVRFEFSSVLGNDECIKWLVDLFGEFVKLIGPRDEWNQVIAAEKKFFVATGVEGRLHDVFMETDSYLHHCKLFFTDGVSGQHRIDGKRGIVMEDHQNLHEQVKPIYILARRFEEFLIFRGIMYVR